MTSVKHLHVSAPGCHPQKSFFFRIKEFYPNTVIYVCYTARYDTFHMLHLDEISSDDVRSRQLLFVSILRVATNLISQYCNFMRINLMSFIILIL